MGLLELSVSKPDWQQAIREMVADAETKARKVLESVGIETIAYLRTLTDEMRPPAKPGEGERHAHPGHWADVSGQLALSYAWDVVGLPGYGARLTLSNSAEYAAWLEARDGFFVLSGVTDPGGPLDEALRHAIAAIAPDWELEVGDVRET